MGFTIDKSKLLLVEGSHEEKFFSRLTRNMGLLDTIQVRQVGGKNLFKPNVKNIRSYDGFHQVESIGIIRDADDSFTDTFNSVQEALRGATLPTPLRSMEFVGNAPRVGVFIAPDNQKNGALENLCLATVEGDPVLDCVEDYFECLKRIQKIDHPHPSKARVQVYLAKEPDGDIHMGIAAERDVWKWDSPALELIREFIRLL
jgi:hypothetical protein